MRTKPKTQEPAEDDVPSLQIVADDGVTANSEKDAVGIWMPLYLGDFFSETKGMSLDEVGAYTTLCALYWRDAGLPNDPTTLRRLLGVTKRKFEKAWSAQSRFFISSGDRLTYPKLDKKRAFWMQKKLQKSRLATKAANQRWHSKKASPGNANAMQTQYTSPSPLPKIYLSPGGPSPEDKPREREPWERVEELVASTYGLTPEEVANLRRQHAKRMKRLTSGAYPTPENFWKFCESTLPLGNEYEKQSRKTPYVQAGQIRSRWWQQWQSETGTKAGKSWEEAEDTQREAFMATKYGDNFRALAESIVGSKWEIGPSGELCSPQPTEIS